MLKRIEKISLALLLSALCGSVLADVVVIAHPSASVSSLDAQSVKKIFLGRINAFPNGDALVAVEQPSGSATMTAFHNKVTKKTPDKLQTYWAKMVLSGKGTKLNVLPGDADVKAWVASHPNALGYIDESQADGSVKVVYSPE